MFDIPSFVAAFGGTLWTILFFIVALSIIVAIHEYGHYIIGRWCGIKAEVFSVGFGPVLFGRTDRHGTYWQVAALPLGGFVKFKGDANAASMPDVAAQSTLTPAQQRETMHGAPVWARAATAAAGPVFNFIFSIILFATLFMVQGQLSDRLKVATLLEVPGTFTIEQGDEITAIDGTAVGNFTDFDVAARGLAPMPVVPYTVLRNGDLLQVTGPYPYPPIAVAVNPQSAALDAGIRAGDVITAANGQPVVAFSE
ncbi:MAG: site-2 protease family protein, partial [Pseudomonadota bacterium]